MIPQFRKNNEAKKIRPDLDPTCSTGVADTFMGPTKGFFCSWPAGSSGKGDSGLGLPGTMWIPHALQEMCMVSQSLVRDSSAPSQLGSSGRAGSGLSGQCPNDSGCNPQITHSCSLGA